MRSKNCLRTSRKSCRKTANCWEKWQLCGQCAVQLHPEEYSQSKVKSWTEMTVVKQTPKISKSYAWSLKRRPRMHTHCLECNKSLENKHYNAKYCSNECKKLVYDSKIANTDRKQYYKTWYKKRKSQALSNAFERDCELCGRNIHEVNPNKKWISKFCSQKCCDINNHMSARKKKVEDTMVRIPLPKYLDLLRGGHIE